MKLFIQPFSLISPCHFNFQCFCGVLREWWIWHIHFKLPIQGFISLLTRHTLLLLLNNLLENPCSPPWYKDSPRFLLSSCCGKSCFHDNQIIWIPALCFPHFRKCKNISRTRRPTIIFLLFLICWIILTI